LIGLNFKNMEKSTRNLVIGGVVLILVLVVIGVYASKPTPPVVINRNPYPKPQPPNNTSLTDLFTFFKNLFTKKSSTNYVQVAPIDSNGCDANGYNEIGVKCDTGY